MKFEDGWYEYEVIGVAPLAGAWIEINVRECDRVAVCVAPLAGAWIEIIFRMAFVVANGSLPSRERGLKLR